MLLNLGINSTKVSGSVMKGTAIGSSNILKKAIIKRTKVRKENFERNKVLRKRHEERERRKSKEGALEVFKNKGKRGFRKIFSAAGGVLDGIMDFISIVLIGWVVNNLPKIVKAIEDLIDRGKKFLDSLGSFITNVREWGEGLGDTIKATIDNWKNFDFTDDSKEVEKAMKKMNDAFEGMKNDVTSMSNAITGEVETTTSGDVGGVDDGKMDASSGAVSIDDTNARALLNAIAEAEGTSRYANQGYNTQYTGKQFSDLSQHPREILGDPSLRSDAAGRYQFLSTTWDSVMGGAMTPDRQDKAALKLVSGRKVNIKNGLSINEIYRLGGEWASIEGGPNMKKGGGYGGQAKYSAEQFMGLYKKYGGTPQSGDGNKKRNKNQSPAYATAVAVGKHLNAKGYDVWQHPDFNVDRGYTGSGNERVMRRGYNSYHNYGEALDVPIMQRDSNGNIISSPEKLDQLYSYLNANRSKFNIAELKWKDDKDHFDHLHVSFKGKGNISNVTVATPSLTTPKRRRKKIIVVQNGGSTPTSMPTYSNPVMIQTGYSLNSVMRNKLLLDLSYT